MWTLKRTSNSNTQKLNFFLITIFGNFFRVFSPDQKVINHVKLNKDRPSEFNTIGNY